MGLDDRSKTGKNNLFRAAFRVLTPIDGRKMARKRRNHFIPRMLLKRFASRLSPDHQKQFIWRFQRSKQPVELSTKDAGVAKDFYGKDDDALENSFVGLEGAHSAALGEIDEGKFAFHARAALLSDMAWLFAMRTEANRLMIQSTMMSALRETALQSSSKSASTFFKRTLERKWDEKLNQLPEYQRFLLALPQMQPELKRLKKELIKQAGGEFSSFLHNMIDDSDLPGLFEHSQNEGLSQHIAAGARCPTARAPRRWSVVESDESRFVLGDACVFATTSDGKVTPLVGGADVRQIYFPICPDKALVGFFDDAEDPLAPEAIRNQSIAFSSRYIFSHSNDADTAAAAEQFIGAEAQMLSPGDERALVSELWVRDD